MSSGTWWSDTIKSIPFLGIRYFLPPLDAAIEYTQSILHRFHSFCGIVHFLFGKCHGPLLAVAVGMWLFNPSSNELLINFVDLSATAVVPFTS